MFGYKFGKVETPVIVTTTETLFFVSKQLYDYISQQPLHIVSIKTANGNTVNIRCHKTLTDCYTVKGTHISFDLSKMWRGENVCIQTQSPLASAMAENYTSFRDAMLEVVTKYRAYSDMFSNKLQYTDATNVVPVQHKPLFGHYQSKETGATIDTKFTATLYVSRELFDFLETRPNGSFSAKNGIILRPASSTSYDGSSFNMKDSSWCGKSIDLHATDLFKTSITEALIQDFEKIKDAFLEAVEVCKNTKQSVISGLTVS